MTTPEPDEADFLQRAMAGDQQALAALFARYRDRLGRMVRLRLDRRMAGRIDTSDVLQDAYLDVARRFPEGVGAPPCPRATPWAGVSCPFRAGAEGKPHPAP